MNWQLLNKMLGNQVPDEEAQEMNQMDQELALPQTLPGMPASAEALPAQQPPSFDEFKQKLIEHIKQKLNQKPKYYPPKDGNNNNTPGIPRA